MDVIICLISWSVLLLSVTIKSLGQPAGGGSGGYYVKVFDIPSICPLQSFCLSWQPTGKYRGVNPAFETWSVNENDTLGLSSPMDIMTVKIGLL